MRFPFNEEIISETVVVRRFEPTTPSDELVWHRDHEDRMVEVLEPGGWLLQQEDQLPLQLEKGAKIFLKAEEWHRVIRGDNALVVKIVKLL